MQLPADMPFQQDMKTTIGRPYSCYTNHQIEMQGNGQNIN